MPLLLAALPSPVVSMLLLLLLKGLRLPLLAPLFLPLPDVCSTPFVVSSRTSSCSCLSSALIPTLPAPLVEAVAVWVLFPSAPAAAPAPAPPADPPSRSRGAESARSSRMRRDGSSPPWAALALLLLLFEVLVVMLLLLVAVAARVFPLSGVEALQARDSVTFKLPGESGAKLAAEPLAQVALVLLPEASVRGVPTAFTEAITSAGIEKL